MNLTHRFWQLIAIATFAIASSSAGAQEGDSYEFTAEEQQQFEQLQAIVESLSPQTGEVELRGDFATLSVPDDFVFFGPEDAETVLVDLWGNMPGQDVLGMLMPAQYSPLQAESWAVTIDYEADGYVSDEDAADINYDELLDEMQQQTLDANPDRIAAGYGEIELLGWAEPPRYNAAEQKLYWAKEIRFDGSQDTTLNYEIRALGRRGILMMTFIASTQQLAEINDHRDAVLAMASFNQGERYIDFDPSIDEVAAYGIGALVAGKLAAKAGFFTVLLVLLKKFGIFLLLGLGAFSRKLKNLFSSNKSQSS